MVVLIVEDLGRPAPARVRECVCVSDWYWEEKKKKRGGVCAPSLRQVPPPHSHTPSLRHKATF